MRTLYHYPLCAFSRLVRIYLKEKFLEHELVVEYPWNRKKVFSEYPLQSDIPTLVDKDGIVLEGWYAIIEHLEQIHARGRHQDAQPHRRERILRHPQD